MDKLKVYILACALKNDPVVLRVKDFPELKRYAEHLEEEYRKRDYCLKTQDGCYVLPFWEIEAIDEFWHGIYSKFGGLGFAYDLEKRAFRFLEGRGLGFPPSCPALRALRFYEVLKEQGYL